MKIELFILTTFPQCTQKALALLMMLLNVFKVFWRDGGVSSIPGHFAISKNIFVDIKISMIFCIFR